LGWGGIGKKTRNADAIRRKTKPILVKREKKTKMRNKGNGGKKMTLTNHNKKGVPFTVGERERKTVKNISKEKSGREM